MRNLRNGMLAGVAVALAACASVRPAPDRAQLEQQVLAAERAFAQTMADRDLAAFSRLVSDEAIFISGSAHLRGKQAVIDGWKPLYDGPSAPFSWQPEYVEVQASGLLALSTGPVRDPSGKIVAQFSSIWRQEAPGVWRVIFDKGNPVCPPPQP